MAANPFPPFQELTSQDFQKYQQQLADTSLQDATGTLFVAAFASMKDFFSDRVRLSLKSRLPGLAPPDALTQIGAERGMPQGGTESGASYAARLLDAWNAWPWAGTAFGLLRAFYATGYTNVVLAQVRGGLVYTLDGTGALVTAAEGNGIWETDPLSSYSPLNQSFWSKFDVVFPQPLIAAWGSGPPASNSTEANFIRAIISAWRPAHATCNRIVIVTAGRVLGYPIRTLGGGNGTLGSNTTVIWTP
jgi:hypothetical protein